MASEPSPGVATETYGQLDKRQPELIEALRAEPSALRPAYKAGNAYVRRNLLHSAAKVGVHREFLAVAIDAYNDGAEWLAALTTINLLAPSLAVEHELPTLDQISNAHGNIERPEKRLQASVVDNLAWNEAANVFTSSP